MTSYTEGTAPSTRDLKYLRWAEAGAKIFSKCLRRQYMAIVVAVDGSVVASGWNSAPPGIPECGDGYCPRVWEESLPGQNYNSCIASHAEVSAFLRSDRRARLGGTIYVNGQPCWDCGKAIVGSGVKRVVLISDPSYEDGERVNNFMRLGDLEVIEVDRALL